jgi:hypothetical protein
MQDFTTWDKVKSALSASVVAEVARTKCPTLPKRHYARRREMMTDIPDDVGEYDPNDDPELEALKSAYLAGDITKEEYKAKLREVIQNIDAEIARLMEEEL